MVLFGKHLLLFWLSWALKLYFLLRNLAKYGWLLISANLYLICDMMCAVTRNQTSYFCTGNCKAVALNIHCEIYFYFLCILTDQLNWSKLKIICRFCKVSLHIQINKDIIIKYYLLADIKVSSCESSRAKSQTSWNQAVSAVAVSAVQDLTHWL